MQSSTAFSAAAVLRPISPANTEPLNNKLASPMKTERTIEEIKKHPHGILPDAERWCVVRCNMDSDFTAGTTVLILTLSHMDTGAARTLRFTNVRFNEPMLVALRDATGLYLMDTTHLGWAKSERIEVGDWDGRPPIFWAETAEQIPEE